MSFRSIHPLSIISDEDETFNDFRKRFGIPLGPNPYNNSSIRLVHDSSGSFIRINSGYKKLESGTSEETLVEKGVVLENDVQERKPTTTIDEVLEKVSDDFSLPRDLIDLISRIIYLTADEYEENIGLFGSNGLNSCDSSSSSCSDQSIIDVHWELQSHFEFSNRLKYMFGGLTKTLTQSTNSQFFSNYRNSSTDDGYASSSESEFSFFSFDDSEELLHVSPRANKTLRFLREQLNKSKLRYKSWSAFFHKFRKSLSQEQSKPQQKKVEFGYIPSNKSIEPFCDCGAIFKLFQESIPAAHIPSGKSCLKPYTVNSLKDYHDKYAPKNEDDLLKYNNSLAAYHTRVNKQISSSKGGNYRWKYFFKATEEQRLRWCARRHARQLRLVKALKK